MKLLLKYLDWWAEILLPAKPDEHALQRAYVMLYVFQILALIVIVGAILLNIAFAQAVRTPDDWLALATEIQRDIEQADFEHRKIDHIDAEDRRFVRKMINELTVSAEAKPTAAQGQWLLKIEEWVKAK